MMQKNLKRGGRILQGLLTAMLAILLLANVGMTVARAAGVENPTVFGWSWAVVLSGSMEPAIAVDDLVITRATDDYAVGDVVMYDGGNSVTTHRIVGETAEGYVTRGDANNTDDPAPVPAEKIVGEVVGVIPRAGRVIGFLRTPLGLMLLLFAGLAMIVLPGRRPKENREEEGHKSNET